MAQEDKYSIEVKEENDRLMPNRFKKLDKELNKLKNKNKSNLSNQINDEQEDEEIQGNDENQNDNEEVQDDNKSEDNDKDKKESEDNDKSKNEDNPENESLSKSEDNDRDSIDNKTNKDSKKDANLDKDKQNSVDTKTKSNNSINNPSMQSNFKDPSKELDKLKNFNEDNPKNKDPQEIIEKAKNKVKHVKNFFTAIIKLVVNPIFWIIVAAVIIFIYIASAITVVGQNDYNILCDSMGVGSVSLSDNADSFTRQSAIVAWLTSTPFEIMNGQPLTREQAIGIMGNLIQESYGANPKAIQGNHSISDWEACDNQCVLGWGDVGGKAIGIIQWDKERRQELVKFAISEGSQWHDLNIQLKFLKKEMDSGYEYEQLIKGGFNQTTKTISEYVEIWNEYFERYGQGNNIRIGYAEEFASKYMGSGVSVGGGLASYCIGGMQGIDTSNLVQLAIASAWPDKTNSRGTCDVLENCGQDFAMAAYKDIKIIAEQNGGVDSGAPGLLASCDRYVATMYKASSKDIGMPWGGANNIANYIKNSSKWVEINCTERQPGDVLWRDGHIMLYLGSVNGEDSIGSASLKTRTGAISGVSCSGNLFVADGDTAQGFRMVGD